jgi:prepilin-type processing-associated H-X9-DG protein
VNFDTGLNTNKDVPWRYDPSNLFPPPVYPVGADQQTKDRVGLETGYRQGALWQYAPNVDVLHCPADARSRVAAIAGAASSPPGNYAYGSYSGAGGFNGEIYAPNTAILKQAEIMHAGQRYLWIEENDPRGENQSSWVMTSPGPPVTAATAFEDSVASWHGGTSTFSWADGHAESHKWLDARTIVYALSNDPQKYFNAQPNLAQCPNDLAYLANGYASQQNP